MKPEKPDSAEVFKRVPANVLGPWLEYEKACAYEYLVGASDPVAIHRSQGKLAFIDYLLKLLEQQNK